MKVKLFFSLILFNISLLSLAQNDETALTLSIISSLEDNFIVLDSIKTEKGYLSETLFKSNDNSKIINTNIWYFTYLPSKNFMLDSLNKLKALDEPFFIYMKFIPSILVEEYVFKDDSTARDIWRNYYYYLVVDKLEPEKTAFIKENKIYCIRNFKMSFDYETQYFISKLKNLLNF